MSGVCRRGGDGFGAHRVGEGGSLRAKAFGVVAARGGGATCGAEAAAESEDFGSENASCGCFPHAAPKLAASEAAEVASAESLAVLRLCMPFSPGETDEAAEIGSAEEIGSAAEIGSAESIAASCLLRIPFLMPCVASSSGAILLRVSNTTLRTSSSSSSSLAARAATCVASTPGAFSPGESGETFGREAPLGALGSNAAGGGGGDEGLDAPLVGEEAAVGRCQAGGPLSHVAMGILAQMEQRQPRLQNSLKVAAREGTPRGEWRDGTSMDAGGRAEE